MALPCAFAYRAARIFFQQARAVVNNWCILDDAALVVVVMMMVMMALDLVLPLPLVLPQLYGLAWPGLADGDLTHWDCIH
ncbi:hypothetical protein CPLU01_01194 [Colletotrichum plurivorum]|uniref:Uncharacterized protein n=1 Tax=Colletotrichum plurivorum TaxID=2175906 RepID=A0A8H6U457_9PEZI|nr:hypothetical protein CPLU01_01194 [Colletotrichum plurivorum]